MPYNNILFIGNSEKFIEAFLKIFDVKDYKVVSWRNINQETINENFNIVVICGYDHNSYAYDYNRFLQSNISYPLNFIKKINNKDIYVYYINTSIPNSKSTFSRYCFAKHSLAIKLNKEFKNFLSIDIPLIMKNKNIEFYAGFFEKKLALLLLSLKNYNYIDIKDLPDFIKKQIDANIKYGLKDVKGKLLSYRRTRFLDKIFRVILN